MVARAGFSETSLQQFHCHRNGYACTRVANDKKSTKTKIQGFKSNSGGILALTKDWPGCHHGDLPVPPARSSSPLCLISTIKPFQTQFLDDVRVIQQTSTLLLHRQTILRILCYALLKRMYPVMANVKKSTLIVCKGDTWDSFAAAGRQNRTAFCSHLPAAEGSITAVCEKLK